MILFALYNKTNAMCFFYSATATLLPVCGHPKLISYGNYIEI